MSGLWRKELRSMLPFLALVVFIAALGLTDEMFTGLPDMMPLARSYEDYVASGREGAIAIFVLTFAMASGLLVREYDEGTMEFLDALPVSRNRVFCVKVAMALAVLLLLIVLDIGTALTLHAWSRTSLNRSFHWPILTTAATLRFCQAFVFLSLGLVLSFLRRFGWLITAMLIWAYILLHEMLPGIAALDIFSLAKPHFEGQRWIIPQKQLAVQLALGGVWMAAAYGLFLGAGDALIRQYRKLAQSRIGNAFLLAGGILIVIAGSGLVYYVMENDPELNSDAGGSEVTITFPSWSTSRAQTEHYEFIYPTNLAGRAANLVAHADSVHETVRSFLGAPAGATIFVDASGLVPRHAGIAYWDKIRLDLSTSDDTETLRSILGHETTHVFLERLSHSRLEEHFNSARFFHEGVATYVQYRLFTSGKQFDALRSVAAVMRSRREVDFRELVDNELLCARRDTDLVYPLGEVFVDALVSRYGEGGIGKVVRALVRDDAPEGLEGMELWRDVFQSCGFNLDGAIDEFFAKLDEQVQRHRELIDSLPRLRGAVESDEYFIHVRVLGEAISGWEPVCRFRQAKDTPDRLYMLAESDEPGHFYLWSASFPGPTVWYQLGLSDGEGRVIYEPWREVALDHHDE